MKQLPVGIQSFIDLQSTGQQVVVVIGEYDKPIIDHLTYLPVAEANRKVLKSFF